MPSGFPLQHLRGPFNFLRPEAREVQEVFPDLERTVPRPRPIFLEEEDATPVQGYAMLLSPASDRLRETLGEYLAAEEQVQAAVLARAPYDRQAQAVAWKRYRELLVRAVENVTLSSYGRNFPALFWLHHSLDVARHLKETPRRVLRADAALGRQHGQAIRYRVMERWLERVLAESYDAVARVAADTEEIEETLFPRLLTRLRDNVLLLTEDHVGADLAELDGYLHGHLGIDAREFRRRIAELAEWSAERLAAEPALARVVEHVVRRPAPTRDPAGSARALLARPGWARFLAGQPGYAAGERAGRLPTAQQVEVWEGLLVKLKEFELLHALRRMILPARLEGGTLVVRGAPARALVASPELRLSSATRPMDFLAPWVVDPQVSRFGLIYDITDFSEIVTMLRRAGSDLQDESFRKMFRLQRRVHRLAEARRIRLEKYLGDGAFYSARTAAPLLAAALHVQRIYRRALDEGFPFDRGLRIALNYSPYRLIPIAGQEPGAEERYEFFGHGVIELSRLTTGKARREIEDVQAMLIGRGYPAHTVHRFFSPLLREDVDRPERDERSRPFFAYIDETGHLVNEGIVATDAFLAELGRELAAAPLARGEDGDRGYVVVALDDAAGPVRVGLRKLGVASLKGLERIPVYEVVDGARWQEGDLVPVAAPALAAAVDRELAGTLLVDA